MYSVVVELSITGFVVKVVVPLTVPSFIGGIVRLVFCTTPTLVFFGRASTRVGRMRVAGSIPKPTFFPADIAWFRHDALQLSNIGYSTRIRLF